MAAVLPYLLVAGGVGVAAEGQRNVERRQKQLADAMREYQLDKAKKGEGAIEDFLKTSTPEARAAQNASAKAELAKGLEESVATTRSYESEKPFAGRVSSAYTGRVASNTAANSERLKRAIADLSTIGTPSETGLKQQFRFGRSASDVDASNAGIRRVGGAYEGAISRVRPNMWQDFLSQLMIGGGLGMAGGTPKALPKPRTGLYDFGPNVPGANSYPQP